MTVSQCRGSIAERSSLEMRAVWFLVVFLGTVVADDQNGPVVKIKDSEILGYYKTSYGGRTYSAFEGVPFAKPPIGDLRFQDPQSLDDWPPSGQFVANETYACMCFIPLPVIYGVKGTEDCLYTYIYVPKEKIEGTENLDVIVHIHGGAFMLGAPKYMAGPDYLMDHDVVFVTLNYRLGILGFLSTEDDVVPGNMGLKDQSMALKWIKENIRYFGGNPDSVTITGLSAGSASVHYHYLSPLSRGLFHRGFSQSGTALQHWALTKNPLNKARTVAATIGCPVDDNKAMVECFKNKDGPELVEGIKSTFAYFEFVPFTPFGPVVEKGGENKFMEDNPYRVLEKGEIYDVPWINSNTIEEGIFPVGFFVMFRKMDEVNAKWNDVMISALDINDTVDDANKLQVVEKIKEHYLKDNQITNDNIYDLVQIFTDRTFVVDSEKALRLHSKHVKSPVYYYSFSYLMEMTSMFSKMRKGVAHGDDGRFLYRIFGNSKVMKGDDEKMLSIFTDFLTEFAHSGKTSLNGKEWKPVNPSIAEIDYLHIGGPDDISMKKKLELAPTAFWNEFPIRENGKI